MYMYEKVSFKDKLINILLSPIDWFSKAHSGKYSDYLEVLGEGKDINTLSKKWIWYFYIAAHIKLFEILSAVYDDYDKQPDHVFVYVDTRLDDLFLELRSLWKKLDSYPFIQEKKLGQYDGFKSLNADSDYRRKVWIASKKTLFEDINDLPKLSTIPLSNDLKLAFLEIDNLLVEHKAKKRKTLFGDGILEYKALKFNLNDSTLCVNNSQPVPVSTKTQVFALLILLIKNVGKVVTYDVIAKELDLNSYDGKVDSDIQRNLQTIKRDIASRIIDLGFDEEVAKEIREYVRFVRNQGAIIGS